jgi:hypothetical protein
MSFQAQASGYNSSVGFFYPNIAGVLYSKGASTEHVDRRRMCCTALPYPQEGPATHLSLVFIACRRHETKHDFRDLPDRLTFFRPVG